MAGRQAPREGCSRRAPGMAVAGRCCWPLFALLLLPPHLCPVGAAARAGGQAVLSAAPGEKIDAAALSQALAESMGYGGGDGVAQLQSALHGIDKEMASLPPALLAGSFARTIAGVLELSRAADAAAGSPMFEAEPGTGKTVRKEWVVHAVGTYSEKVSLTVTFSDPQTYFVEQVRRSRAKGRCWRCSPRSCRRRPGCAS